MLNGRRIVSLCTTRLNEVENCRFITKLNNTLKKSNTSLFVYNINTEIYWDDSNIRAESAVFSLVDYDITDIVIIMYEKIKSRTIVEKIVSDAKSRNVPVIIVDSELEGCINVRFDYARGFESVVRHVIEFHGVKNPHMMAGIKDNPYSEERIAAFKKVIAENGIQFNDSMISYGEFWAQPCREAAEKLLETGELPEAIICANDIMAINVCDILNKHGYVVPDDIIVTGFDGIDDINHFIPKITSSYCGTAAAVDDLAAIIDDVFAGNASPCMKYVEPELLINESCGCKLDEFENPSFIFGFNNRFYRYQDDFQQFYSMSERMIAQESLAECARELQKAQIGHLTILIKKKYTDFTQDHFLNPSQSKFSDELFVFYESDAPDFVQRDFSKRDIVPDIDQFLDHNAPLVFNVIAFMNIPIGYICFHLPEFDISDYCKIPQLVSAAGSGIGGFINTRYQQYLTMRIEKMYKYDSLTNLYNRLSFNKEFETLKESFHGRKVPLSIILIDLDGLKKINDSFGHGAGDNAIRTIATALKEACPENALCVRFGGDEMLAVIPGECAPEEIKKDINRRLDLYNTTENKPYIVSASTGIYCTDSTQNTDFEYLIKEADTAMYTEKVAKRKKK